MKLFRTNSPRNSIIFKVKERFVSASWVYDSITRQYVCRVLSASSLTFAEAALTIAYARVAES